MFSERNERGRERESDSWKLNFSHLAAFKYFSLFHYWQLHEYTQLYHRWHSINRRIPFIEETVLSWRIVEQISSAKYTRISRMPTRNNKLLISDNRICCWALWLCSISKALRNCSHDGFVGKFPYNNGSIY